MATFQLSQSVIAREVPHLITALAVSQFRGELVRVRVIADGSRRRGIRSRSGCNISISNGHEEKVTGSTYIAMAGGCSELSSF